MELLKRALKAAGYRAGFTVGWLYWWVVPTISLFDPIDDMITCIPGALQGEIRAYRLWRKYIAQ
jgi:hypothetical protein